MESIKEIFASKSNPISGVQMKEPGQSFERLDKVNGEERPPVHSLPPNFQEAINQTKEIGDLPQPFLDTLDDLRDLDDYDKLSIIHSFALDYMKYEEPGSDEQLAGISDIIKNDGHGDCDDYASLEISLLRYAGFDKEDIAFLTSRSNFKAENGAEITGKHAVAIVGDYVLDLNLKDPAILHTDTMSYSGQSMSEDMGKMVVNIEEAIVMVKHNEVTVYNAVHELDQERFKTETTTGNDVSEQVHLRDNPFIPGI